MMLNKLEENYIKGPDRDSYSDRVDAYTSGRPYIFFKIEVTPIRKSLLFMNL